MKSHLPSMLIIGFLHLPQSHYPIVMMPPAESRFAALDAIPSDPRNSADATPPRQSESREAVMRYVSGNDEMVDFSSLTGRWVVSDKYAHKVGRIVSSFDERWLLTVGRNKISLWDAAQGIERFQFIIKQGNLSAVTISNDNRFVAIGYHYATDNRAFIELWELATGTLLRIYSVGKMPITAVCFSPDGDWILSGSENGEVRVWRTSSASEVKRNTESLLAGGARILTIDSLKLRSYGKVAAFSPNGTLLITNEWDKSTEIYSFDGDERKQLRMKERITAAAFSPDGRWLVTGDEDGVVRLWDTVSWKEMERLRR